MTSKLSISITLTTLCVLITIHADHSPPLLLQSKCRRHTCSQLFNSLPSKFRTHTMPTYKIQAILLSVCAYNYTPIRLFIQTVYKNSTCSTHWPIKMQEVYMLALVQHIGQSNQVSIFGKKVNACSFNIYRPIVL